MTFLINPCLRSIVAADDILACVRQLVALQRIDGRIHQHKKELAVQPQRLKELEQRFEEKKTTLRRLEDELKTIQVQRGHLETDLQAKEEAISKANRQLSEIKTNREYAAKITEIEGLKAERERLEENILMHYEQADAVRAKIEEEKKRVAEYEQEFMKQKAQLEERARVLATEIERDQRQRQSLAAGVPKDILSRYERILHGRDGLAIVPVEGEACGGCFMNIPPQMINEIRLGRDLIYCEMCARMLYLPEQVEGTADASSPPS